MKNFISFMIVILSLSLFLGSCRRIKSPLNPLETKGAFVASGTIQYIDLEGGFYGIIADNGKHYFPINLPDEFRVEGLRVRFTAIMRNDVATIYMWGTPVEILKIEKLE